ncbi:MAG: hypothetical protein JSW37_07260, partial [Anaerolineales bacterium]
MNHISESILVQCLEQLENGQPVESILARFSEYASELRPILECSRELQRLSAEPPREVQQRARAGFLAQAAAQATGGAKRRAWLSFRPRLLPQAAALMLLLLVVGTIVVPASASALPGDLLYGTKRAVEEWRLFVAAGPAAEAELTASFRQERLREIVQLVAGGRDVEVSFVGTLQSVTERQWTVGGLLVELDSETVIVGSPREGAEVRVTGWTGSGGLFASEIRALDDDDLDDDDAGGVGDDHDDDDRDDDDDDDRYDDDDRDDDDDDDDRDDDDDDDDRDD